MATKPTPGRLGIAVPFGELLGGSTAEMNAELADYVSMGVDWIRTDFWWHLAQPTARGGYDWTLIDRVVDAAERHGIEVIGELNGMPRWTGLDMSTRANQKAYGEFAAAAAAHFDDRVDHWEIFNEQNMAGISPASYTEMLKAAHGAIKAFDAEDVVITGGLAAVPSSTGSFVGAVEYLEGIYENGGKGHFDVVGFHPYTYPLMPEDSKPWNGWQIMEDGIRGTMVANGDADLPIWITELGAPTAGGGSAMSQAEQARIIEQAVDLAGEESWAGPIFWYSYQDRGGSRGDTENWFGLVGPNGERKDAYHTFKAIATAQMNADDRAPVETGASPKETAERPAPKEATVADRDDGPSLSEPTFAGRRYRGDDGDDTIVGNDRGNIIRGRGGDDVIDGGEGRDVLFGDGGNDTLRGGEGADRFVFDRPKTMGWDTIEDFERGDRINLKRIDADATVRGNQAFDFIGGDWLSDAGDLGFYKDRGGWTSVQGDTDGDGAYDFSIRLDGLHRRPAPLVLVEAQVAGVRQPVTPDEVEGLVAAARGVGVRAPQVDPVALPEVLDRVPAHGLHGAEHEPVGAAASPKNVVAPAAAVDHVVAAIPADRVVALAAGEGDVVVGRRAGRDDVRGGGLGAAILRRGDRLVGVVGVLALAVGTHQAEPVLHGALAAAAVLVGVPQDRPGPGLLAREGDRLLDDLGLGGLRNGAAAAGRGRAELGHPDLEVAVAVGDHGRADAVLHDLPAVPGLRVLGQERVGVGVIAHRVEVALAAVLVDPLEVVHRADQPAPRGGRGGEAPGDHHGVRVHGLDRRVGLLEQVGVVRGRDALHVLLVPHLPVIDPALVALHGRGRVVGERLPARLGAEAAVGPGGRAVELADHLDAVTLRRVHDAVDQRPVVVVALPALHQVPPEVGAHPFDAHRRIVGEFGLHFGRGLAEDLAQRRGHSELAGGLFHRHGIPLHSRDSADAHSGESHAAEAGRFPFGSIVSRCEGVSAALNRMPAAGDSRRREPAIRLGENLPLALRDPWEPGDKLNHINLSGPGRSGSDRGGRVRPVADRRTAARQSGRRPRAPATTSR